MTRFSILMTTTILYLVTSPSQAGLLISVDNLAITAGRVGTLDVYVSSSDGLLNNVDSFGFDFEITKVSGQGRLEFTPNQTDPFPSSKYIFSMNSGDDTSPGQTSLGTVASTNSPRDTYVGSDYTSDGSNITVIGSMLIAHLDLTASTSLPPTVASTFQISMVRNANTFFFHDSGTTPGEDLFSVVGGLVTISAPFGSGGPTSVPEPSSLFSALIYGLPALLVLGRRYVKAEAKA